MLLVDGDDLRSSPEPRAIIEETGPDVVRLLGGTAALSSSVERQVRLLLR